METSSVLKSSGLRLEDGELMEKRALFQEVTVWMLPLRKSEVSGTYSKLGPGKKGYSKIPLPSNQWGRQLENSSKWEFRLSSYSVTDCSIIWRQFILRFILCSTVFPLSVSHSRPHTLLPTTELSYQYNSFLGKLSHRRKGLYAKTLWGF